MTPWVGGYVAKVYLTTLPGGYAATCLLGYKAIKVITWVRGYAAMCPRVFVTLVFAAACYVVRWLCDCVRIRTYVIVTRQCG